jgi:pyruvate formate lyase activating enzyme
MTRPPDSLLVLNTGFTVEVDGPGQRMVVYLKGCNMCCPWCAAPESMNPLSEVLFYPRRVDDPKRVAEACPNGAVELGNPVPLREVAICRSCGDHPCVTSDNPAFELAGGEMSVRDIIDKVVRYRSFYSKLGGVTIGGGEPTCQFKGVKSLLTRLHEKGIHTAMETNGSSPQLSELFPALDLLYIDLKHPDDAEASRMTGQGNAMILDNIRQRNAQDGRMTVRICLVPGYNSDEDILHLFGSTLSAIGPLNVEILPFHRRGQVKWEALGRRMPAGDVTEPSREMVRRAAEILRGHGLRVGTA